MSREAGRPVCSNARAIASVGLEFSLQAGWSAVWLGAAKNGRGASRNAWGLLVVVRRKTCAGTLKRELQQSNRLHPARSFSYPEASCDNEVLSEVFMQFDSRERGGWGRMELAVAVFIVLLLVAIGVPAMLWSRERARREMCADRLRALGQGARAYSSEYEAFPFGSQVNPKLPPEKRLSWYVAAWPYAVPDGFHGSELEIDRRAAWDAPGNLAPQVRMGDQIIPFDRPEMFRCPSAGVVIAKETGPGPTELVGMAGVGPRAWTLPSDLRKRGVWNVDVQTSIDELTRGQAHAQLLLETARDNGVWTASGTPTLRGFDPAGSPPIGGLGQFGGWHAGGANVVYVDGHMQFVAEKIDPHIFSSQCLIARPD